MKREMKGKTSRTGVSAAAIVAALLLATPILLLIAPVYATSITSVSPTSGTVGTTVTLTGTIDVPNGPFKVYFDINGDNVFDDPGEVVASGTASGTSVSATFNVPEASKGYHAIRLTDVLANTHAFFATFEVLRSVEIEFSPSTGRIREGDSIGIIVRIRGGLASTTYSLLIKVTDPTSTERSATLSITTNSLGSGTGSVTYPTAFAGADTNLLGLYNVVVDITAPSSEAASSVASGSFTVGLTDKASYERTETVNIKGAGYGDSEPVTINIQDPSGASVAGYPKNVIASSAGVVTDSFTIPKNALTGVYIVTLTGTTTTKTPPDIESFTVSTATLTVTITDQPASTYQRTQTAVMKFRVTYPDGSPFTPSDLGSVTVRVYRGATIVATLSLSASNFESATNKWVASWTIPKDATTASDYRFEIDASAITDPFINTGPASTVSSNDFAVTAATLSVTITVQPSPTYTRGDTATMKFRVTYPDGSFFTPSDLASVTVRVFRGATLLDTLSLSASDFESGTNNWVASWTIPSGAVTASNYRFQIDVNAIQDSRTPPNRGPASIVTSNNFAVIALDTVYDVAIAIYNIVNNIDTKLGMFGSGESVKSLLDDIKGTLGTFGPGESVKGLLVAIDTKLGMFGSGESVKSLLDDIKGTLGTFGPGESVKGLLVAIDTKLGMFGSGESVKSLLGTFNPGESVASLLYQIRTAVTALETAVTALDLTPVRAGDVVSSKAGTNIAVSSASPYVIGGFPANKAFRGTLTIEIDTTLGSGVFLAVEVWDGDSWARVWRSASNAPAGTAVSIDIAGLTDGTGNAVRIVTNAATSRQFDYVFVYHIDLG
jgi:hypothetical protein